MFTQEILTFRRPKSSHWSRALIFGAKRVLVNPRYQGASVTTFQYWGHFFYNGRPSDGPGGARHAGVPTSAEENADVRSARVFSSEVFG